MSGERERSRSPISRGVRSQKRGRDNFLCNFTHIHRLEFQDLVELAKCSPSDAIIKLQGDLKGFQHSLNSCSKVSPSAKPHYVMIIIDILLKVYQAQSENREAAMSILAEFLTERCAEFHMLLKKYINTDINAMSFNKLVILFRGLLDTLPTSAWPVLPIDDMVDALQYQPLLDSKLIDDIHQLKAQRNDVRKQCKQAKKEYTDSTVLVSNDWDNSQYRYFPILPTIDEICSVVSPQLRPSIIHGAYTGWEHYYDVQFRLLREDFLAPLRRGVSMVCSEQRLGRSTDVNIYRSMKIVEPEFTEDGLCYVVQFDVSLFRQRKTWEHSKRLIFGSLLCFTPQQDNFKDNIYFATVINRDPKELEKGIFQVKFEDGLQMFQHIQKTVFTVIESKAYFEASRHILRSLQMAEIHTMPFTRYLIENKPLPVQMPKYLEGNARPCYDLCWLYRNSCSKPIKDSRASLHRRLREGQLFTSNEHLVNIVEDSAWPSADELELDKSQLAAIKMALTQEIAVIQGPPGTGKTYIGYKIVQTLLQNRHIWDPNSTSPILVMCYTNHALDQFLEGIIHHKIDNDRTPEIVRIGGRSQSEEIQKCNLKNVRRRVVPHHMLNYVCKLRKDFINTTSSIPLPNLQRLIQESVNEYIVSPEGLYQLKPVINPSHFYQLMQLGKSFGMVEYSLEIWLGLWEEQYRPVGKEVNMEDNLVDQEMEVDVNEDSMYNAIIAINEEESNGDISDDFNEEDVVDVVGEAEIEEANRKLDDDSYCRIDVTKEWEDYVEVDDALSKYIKKSQIEKKTGDAKDNKQEDNPSIILQLVKREKPEVRRILQQICNCEPLDSEDESTIFNIVKLSFHERRQLFKLWFSKYQLRLHSLSQSGVADFEAACQQYKREQQALDRFALEHAEVIGMTTTGAAKYQHILHLVKPKIVIVEEAAEVLESHIVSALNAGTQHLILIGDHKQLKPKPNEYELAKKYNLDVSLFERLIRNNLPHATLEIQHRMRPQIAHLVCPFIYEKLINHDNVKQYEDVKGFAKNMFFFHHEHPEIEIEHLLSHSNEYEAKFVVALCTHLLNQNYKPSQITILTAYTGQLLKIRNLMPRKHFEGVRVINVDNFQGEENDIIILSLVRSNNSDKVGFLKEENRVCVALSRAKMGFYCFGNFKMLRKVVPIWEVIMSHVSKEGCLGDAFPLFCYNHPEKKYNIQEPEQFPQYFPDGGCTELCSCRLDCGHRCRRRCHVIDSDHKQYKCKQSCPKCCRNGEHLCKARCYEKCPPCKEIVSKTIPLCGHKQVMFCNQSPDLQLCLSPCPKLCANNLHPCKARCYEKCPPCKERVRKTIPLCGHKQVMFCNQSPDLQRCLSPCPKLCANNLHPCKARCYEKCPPCKERVRKTIPLCGHKQVMFCNQSPDLQRCLSPCPKLCANNLHPCKARCYEKCPPCKERVRKTIPLCGHKQVMFCYQSPDVQQCLRPCPKLCANNLHHCPLKCSEKCEPCSIQVVQTMPTCGHQQKMKCHNDPQKMKCKHKCTKVCANNHPCQKRCWEDCGLCEVIVKKIMPQCKHLQYMPCYLDPSKFECQERCSNIYDNCGHRCPKLCYEQCHILCQLPLMKIVPKCNHVERIPCSVDAIFWRCTKPCERELCCGHICKSLCGEVCLSTKCQEPTTVILPCKHSIIVECKNSSKIRVDTLLQGSYQCDEPCEKPLNCGHKCRKKCSQLCTDTCKFKVTYQCQNGHSAKIPCYQKQNPALLPPCDRPCTQKLPCGHLCKNLCGESCTEHCPEIVNKKCLCGHLHKTKCGDTIGRCTCTKDCNETLLCGHKCSGKCIDCFTKRIHPPCPFEVQINRFCGHFDTVPCVGMQDHCTEICQLSVCPHEGKPCTHHCGEICSYKCTEECFNECSHHKCHQSCNDICEQSSCDKPCTKTLKCRHHCPGLCGEKCLSTCMICDPKKFREKAGGIGKKGKLESHRYIQLNCGDMFTVSYLTKRFKPKHTESHLITPLLCPKCSKPVMSSHYWKMIKERRKEIEEVKDIAAAFHGTNPEFNKLKKDVISILIRENITVTVSKKGYVRPLLGYNIPLDNTIECACAMELLLCTDNLHETLKECILNPNLVDQAYKLVREVAFVVADKKGKLSPQLIHDIQSEIFRLNLTALTEQIRSEPLIVTNTLEMRKLESVLSMLHQMEQNHNLRLTSPEYEENLSIIQRIHEEMFNFHIEPFVTLNIQHLQ